MIARGISSTAKLVRFALAIAAAWLAVALISSFQNFMSSVVHSQDASWSAAVASALPWYASWALLTPYVIWMAVRFTPGRCGVSGFLLLHLLGAIVTGVAHSACYAVLTVLAGRDPALAGAEVFMRLASHGHAYVLLYSIIVGLTFGARAYRALRDRELAAAKLQMRLTEAETAALRAQLQPHFLFNTLNAISALVPEEPLAAQRLIAKLGDLLRLSIEEHHEAQSILADELDFTNLYLAIEQARLGERLQIVRRIAADALSCAVPTMLLQPLVENAIRHGIAPLASGGTLTIEASRDDGGLSLCVTDDGRGAAVIVEGVGLGNSRARLQQFYGSRHAFKIVTAPQQGFCVKIRIPA